MPPAYYTVINLRTQERGAFTRARDVAVFMWGRDFREYVVRKNGAIFSWPTDNLAAFETALEAA